MSIALRLYANSGAQIHLGKFLKTGGQGFVFEHPYNKNYVIKIYKQGKLPKDIKPKLECMVRWKTPKLTENVSWPVETWSVKVVENNVTYYSQAYVMPRADGESLHVLYDEEGRRYKFPNATYGFFIRVARNICAALDNIHRAGALVCDFKPANINLMSDGRVWILDADSFFIHDSVQRKIYSCPVGTPEFYSPEMFGQKSNSIIYTVEHDNWVLASIIYRLLFLGSSPYDTTKDHGLTQEQLFVGNYYIHGDKVGKLGWQNPLTSPSISTIPLQISQLLKRSFTPLSQLPSGGRPTALEWLNALACMEKSLIKCKKYSVHEYYSGSPFCPFCDIYKRTGYNYFAIFQPTLIHARTQSSGSRLFKITSIASSSVVSKQYKRQLPLQLSVERCFSFLKRVILWLYTDSLRFTIICSIIRASIIYILWLREKQRSGAPDGIWQLIAAFVVFVPSWGPKLICLGGMFVAVIFFVIEVLGSVAQGKVPDFSTAREIFLLFLLWTLLAYPDFYRKLF